jgi:hypothetical protein
VTFTGYREDAKALFQPSTFVSPSAASPSGMIIEALDAGAPVTRRRRRLGAPHGAFPWNSCR